MTSKFTKGVMISLNEHMAQTLLDGMAATIRMERLDPDLQIKGLEMLVDSLEALNSRVSRFMGELKSNKENTFNYDELDLDGLDEWKEQQQLPRLKCNNDKYNHISRTPSPITLNFVPRAKFAARSLAPLFEEELIPRLSFERVVSDTSLKPSKSVGSRKSITIKVEMPGNPSFSSSAEASMSISSMTMSPPLAIRTEFRQIDPKKMPKRKPVPSQPQAPPQKANNQKAFKRKEVPQRFYGVPTAASSSATVNTFNATSNGTGAGIASNSGFGKSVESIWTPPATDEESSPVRWRWSPKTKSTTTTAATATATATATTMPTVDTTVATPPVCQQKPRRNRSKPLKIAIPHRRASAGKPARTPSTGSVGSARFQKRTMEELDKAMAAVRLSFEENGSSGTNHIHNSNNAAIVSTAKRVDSGKERRSGGGMKRRVSMGRRRRRYSSGIPRCDSPVLGEYEVVMFAVPASRKR